MTHLPWQNGSKAERALALELAEKVAAVERSQAVVEFSLDGTVLHANSLFLSMLGYSFDEVQGRNYKMFAEPSYAQSSEYGKFFDRLLQGQFISGEFLLKAKSGSDIWTEASFSPLLDGQGTPYKVVVLAINTTEEVLRSLESKEKIDAISRSHAVVEMNMDGTIITANKNFLDALGYSLDQIRGKHHSMFLAPTEAQSPVYRQLWDQLSRGQYVGGEFKRRNQKGQDVWLEATYNPVLDRSGKPFKVVEFATDITQHFLENVEKNGQVDAINRCQAVIHFALDGTVLWANDNFLQATGYSLSEVVGRHHKMFVDSKYRESKEYKTFWDDLRSGKDCHGIFCRQKSNGSPLWLQATYAPIADSDGKLLKVVKFAQDVTESVQRREDSGRAVDSTFGQIIGAVSTVSQQSQSVSNASETTLETVQAVAAASEELSASINAIGQSMDESKAAVEIVNRETLLAEESTKRLDEKAGEMNKIADLIKEIADQINLLSLNAAIESARAGDAGRGFAVVAGEVKNLANQVQSATVNISKEINDMQGVARDVVKALSIILKSVESVDDAVNGVASAVEQQTTATGEISSHMQRATSEVKNITDNLSAMLYSIEQVDTLAANGKDALLAMSS